MVLKEYKVVLLDLDGTITDPGEGIRKSIAYALEKFGIVGESDEALNRFIGPPLWKSFEKFYDFTKEDAQKGVEYYRERYTEKGIYESTLIDGAKKLIMELKSKGKTVILATSKPEIFAKKVLEIYGLTKYFDFIGGATIDQSRSEKADVIAYALESANVSDKSEAVMIGDRDFDIIGAKINGIDSIGVNCGYGSTEEFIKAKADYVFNNMYELIKEII